MLLRNFVDDIGEQTEQCMVMMMVQANQGSETEKPGFGRGGVYPASFNDVFSEGRDICALGQALHVDTEEEHRHTPEEHGHTQVH